LGGIAQEPVSRWMKSSVLVGKIERGHGFWKNYVGLIISRFTVLLVGIFLLKGVRWGFGGLWGVSYVVWQKGLASACERAEKCKKLLTSQRLWINQGSQDRAKSFGGPEVQNYPPLPP